LLIFQRSVHIYDQCYSSPVLQLLNYLQLGDDIHEFYQEKFGKVPTAEMLTHLRRELMQAVWLKLFDDDEFMHAYLHGFEMDFLDQLMAILFPRFLAHSADYPEKYVVFLILCGNMSYKFSKNSNGLPEIFSNMPMSSMSCFENKDPQNRNYTRLPRSGQQHAC